MRCAQSGNLNMSFSEKNNVSSALHKEQKKLEKMILEALEKGNTNLGNNNDILKQSIEVDKLIVNEMLKAGVADADSVTNK